MMAGLTLAVAVAVAADPLALPPLLDDTGVLVALFRFVLLFIGVLIPLSVELSTEPFEFVFVPPTVELVLHPIKITIKRVRNKCIDFFIEILRL